MKFKIEDKKTFVKSQKEKFQGKIIRTEYFETNITLKLLEIIRNI